MPEHKFQWPTGISPDGTHLVFEEQTANGDLMVVTLDKDHRIEPLVRSRMYAERNGEISPTVAGRRTNPTSPAVRDLRATVP